MRALRCKRAGAVRCGAALSRAGLRVGEPDGWPMPAGAAGMGGRRAGGGRAGGFVEGGRLAWREGAGLPGGEELFEVSEQARDVLIQAVEQARMGDDATAQAGARRAGQVGCF